MRFSIIIPTYNSMRWLSTSLESVLSQTSKDFDVLIVDSGSTDGTIEWLTSRHDDRIRIYTTESRLNITENWQRFTTIPRNEFMTIMGHDDILYPDYLETINRLIEQHPRAGLYQTHFNFIDGKSRHIRKCAPMKHQYSMPELLNAMIQHSIEITATGFMIRSADYDAVGGIPPYPNLLYADSELWLELTRNSYLAVAEQTCFEFRFHIENTSKSSGEIRLIAFEMLVDYLVSLKNSDNISRDIIKKNGHFFLKNYAVGSCNKLIYVPKKQRENVTMDMIVASADRCARKLLAGEDFTAGKLPGIKLAKIIDSSELLRSLFLFYKGLKKRTF